MEATQIIWENHQCQTLPNHPSLLGLDKYREARNRADLLASEIAAREQAMAESEVLIDQLEGEAEAEAIARHEEHQAQVDYEEHEWTRWN